MKQCHWAVACSEVRVFINKRKLCLQMWFAQHWIRHQLPFRGLLWGNLLRIQETAHWQTVQPQPVSSKCPVNLNLSSTCSSFLLSHRAGDVCLSVCLSVCVCVMVLNNVFLHFGLWRHLVAVHVIFKYFLFPCITNYSFHLCLVAPVTLPIKPCI